MLPQDETQTLQYPIGTLHPSPCPECGGKLFLNVSRYGPYYMCENLYQYGCDGTAGAHATGEPLGIPGNKRIRQMRIVLHNQIDPLWQQYRGETVKQKRDEIYELLRSEFVRQGKLTDEQKFHVADLDEAGLQLASSITKNILKRRFI